MLYFDQFFLCKVANDKLFFQESAESLLKNILQVGSTATTVQFRLPQDPAAEEFRQDPAEEEN